MSKLTVLHLSDLHCDVTYEAESLYVFANFIEDLKYWKKYHNEDQINIIFITGDITKEGANSENYGMAYDRINEILKVTGLSPNDLFIVPGNRDFNHHAVTPELINKRNEIYDKMDGDIGLADYDTLKLFISCFDNYRAFIDIIGNDKIKWKNDHGMIKPWYLVKNTIVGKNISIIGLTTPIYSCYKIDNGKIIPCEGEDRKLRYRTLFGKKQLLETLNKTNREDFILVLSHHPLDDIDSKERGIIKALMEEYHVVHLHGHTHELAVETSEGSAENRSVSIGAGCLYREYDKPCGYNIIQFDFDKESITQWPRRWGPFAKRWHPDWEWNDLTIDHYFVKPLPTSNKAQEREIYVVTDPRFYDSALFYWLFYNNKHIFKHLGYNIKLQNKDWRNIEQYIADLGHPAIAFYNRKFEEQDTRGKLKCWSDFCIYKGYALIAKDDGKHSLSKPIPTLSEAKKYLHDLLENDGTSIFVDMGGDTNWRFRKNLLIEELNAIYNTEHELKTGKNIIFFPRTRDVDSALEFFIKTKEASLFIGGLPQRLSARENGCIELITYENCPFLFSLNSLSYNNDLDSSDAKLCLSHISHIWFETISQLKLDYNYRNKMFDDIKNMLESHPDFKNHKLTKDNWHKVISTKEYIVFPNSPGDLTNELSCLTDEVISKYETYAHTGITREDYYKNIFKNLKEIIDEETL